MFPFNPVYPPPFQLSPRPKEVRIAEKRAEIQRLTATIAQLEHDIAMIQAGVL